MASKKDKTPDKRAPSLPQIGKATIDQMKLAKRYYSGALEEDRKMLQLLGAMPWRILRYERIIDPDQAILPIPRSAVVAPKTFRKHLRVLKRDCIVCSLEELIDLLMAGKPIPDKAVAITIDGGWMDTFLYALPIIQEEQVPVTVFIPTAFIGTNHLFWPDRVALALLEMKRAERTIEPFEFFSQDVKDVFAKVCPDGVVTFQSIFLMVEGLRRANPIHRRMAVGFLGEIFNALGGQMPLNPFFMQWSEVEAMENLGVQFGSLGHAHVSYRELEPDEALDDITRSMDELRQRLKNPVPVFAAPYGDFEGKNADALVAAGLRACLLEEGIEDRFAVAEPIRLMRRICPEESNTFSSELFFCKVWDIPLQELE